MTKEEINKIEESVKKMKETAEWLLEGNGDGSYDGADGMRIVIEVCEMAEKLLSELDKK